MILYLLTLFVAVPLVELALLLWLAEQISWQATILLVLITGIVGSIAARRQGLGIWLQVQRQLQAGQLPGASIVDGVLVLVAGALLITPGILTDIVGFALLVPFVRRQIRRRLMRALIRRTEWRVRVMEPDRPFTREDTFDSPAVRPDGDDESGDAGSNRWTDGSPW